MNYLYRRFEYGRTLAAKRNVLDQITTDTIAWTARSISENWSPDEIAGQDQSDLDKCQQAEEDISLTVTNFWVKEADRLVVPLPERTDDAMWYDGYFLRARFLTDRGVDTVRRAVREERKALLEPWVTYVTVLVGLIGGIIGYLLPRD